MISQEELVSELEIPLDHMANNKVPGPDCVVTEILKLGGPALLRELQGLLLSIWRTEQISNDMKNGNIVTILKKLSSSFCHLQTVRSCHLG